jgi:putative transcriptional regulator
MSSAGVMPPGRRTGRRRRALAAGLLVLALLLVPGRPSAVPGPAERGGASLAGRLLVAAPELADPNFARTVVLMVLHNEEGAFGLVVNRPYGMAPLGAFLRGLGKDPGDAEREVEFFYGGPVEPGIGFVVHGADYAIEATRNVTAELRVTSDPAILRDILDGRGPARPLITLGYAGWGPSQLESELARQDWLTIPAGADLVLALPPARKWRAALDRRGTDL